MTDQLKCPSAGCANPVPDDPGALGWREYEELWWCDSHWYGEWRRVKTYAEHIAQYTTDTLQRETEILRLDAERQNLVLHSRARRRDRRHPVSPEEERRTAMRFISIDNRVVFLNRQLQAINDYRVNDEAQYAEANDTHAEEAQTDLSSITEL